MTRRAGESPLRETGVYPFFSATMSRTPASFQTIDRSSRTIASGASCGVWPNAVSTRGERPRSRIIATNRSRTSRFCEGSVTSSRKPWRLTNVKAGEVGGVLLDLDGDPRVVLEILHLPAVLRGEEVEVAAVEDVHERGDVRVLVARAERDPGHVLAPDQGVVLLFWNLGDLCQGPRYHHSTSPLSRPHG